MIEEWNVGRVGDKGKNNYVKVETRLDRHSKVDF
jgi:hypothetical protein